MPFCPYLSFPSLYNTQLLIILSHTTFASLDFGSLHENPFPSLLTSKVIYSGLCLAIPYPGGKKKQTFTEPHHCPKCPYSVWASCFFIFHFIFKRSGFFPISHINNLSWGRLDQTEVVCVSLLLRARPGMEYFFLFK